MPKSLRNYYTNIHITRDTNDPNIIPVQCDQNHNWPLPIVWRVYFRKLEIGSYIEIDYNDRLGYLRYGGGKLSEGIPVSHCQK